MISGGDDRQIEVQNLFPYADLLVQRDGGSVFIVRLHEQHMRPALAGDFLEACDQSGRDANRGETQSSPRAHNH